MSNVELAEKFITRTNPYQLWENLFACSPKDTDIQSGAQSYAANAVEQALEALGDNIDAEMLGAPFELSFEKNKYTLNHIRKKLMGSAILAVTQETAKANALDFEVEDEGMGVIGLLGDMTNVVELMNGIGLNGVSELIKTSDCSYNQSPIYIKSGNPAIELEINDKKFIQGVMGLVLNEHLRDIILRKNINNLEVGVSTNTFDLSPYLSFADEEDRYRINEIIRSVQRSIDEGEGDIENLIRFAPFRSTLLQNMTLRILEDLEEELENFGMKKVSGNKYAVSFNSIKDMKPLVYRLMGDIHYRTLGLVRREVVKRVSIRLPIFKEEGPAFCIVQPDEISMRTFTEISGGADAFVILPEAAASSEELLDMQDGIILDEDSVDDFDAVTQVITDIFPDAEFINTTN